MVASDKHIILLSARSWSVRIVIAAVAIVLFAGGWFAVRWQLGNMLAGLTAPSEPNAQELAQLAKALAPLDPSTNWLEAVVDKQLVTPDKLREAVEGHKTTVRLSPYHFQWWLELGRALEQAARVEEAEKAFRRAVELAPNYTLPHWQLGNFYLRQGREDEAFRELKTAAENDVVYREQVYSIAWDYYERDEKKLEEVVGGDPGVRVGLAKFYAGRDRPARSLDMWRSLTQAEREANREVGLLIAQALFEKRNLNEALDFVNDLGIEENLRKEAVQNPGFEEDISSGKDIYFGWNIAPVEKVRIQLSRTEHQEGERSLRMTFSGFENAELNTIYQTIALRSGSSYVLRFWLRTEELKSAGTPLIEVLHPAENRIIAASAAFPSGTNSWQEISIPFEVPEDADGVVVRTARSFCGDKCPIYGSIWYDGFSLSRSAPADE